MRYETKSDLPETITKVLPEEAWDVYLEGYHLGWEMYKESTAGGLSRESVAHRQGWMMMKQEFERDPKSGDWHRKDEEAATADQESTGLLDRVQIIALSKPLWRGNLPALYRPHRYAARRNSLSVDENFARATLFKTTPQFRPL